ncbi:MAG: hypothetical protein MMC33_004864 [Icmadophila ericetorum]|nr:hypothetical protein [Icmadophila ericetorum]
MAKAGTRRPFDLNARLAFSSRISKRPKPAGAKPFTGYQAIASRTLDATCGMSSEGAEDISIGDPFEEMAATLEGYRVSLDGNPELSFFISKRLDKFADHLDTIIADIASFRDEITTLQRKRSPHRLSLRVPPRPQTCNNPVPTTLISGDQSLSDMTSPSLQHPTLEHSLSASYSSSTPYCTSLTGSASGDSNTSSTSMAEDEGYDSHPEGGVVIKVEDSAENTDMEMDGDEEELKVVTILEMPGNLKFYKFGGFYYEVDKLESTFREPAIWEHQDQVEYFD